MRLFTYAILASLIICLLSDTSFSQRRGRARSKSSSASTRTTIPPADPRLTPPTKRAFNHNFEIETRYDKFNDITTVSLLMILTAEPEAFSISAGFSYKGRVAGIIEAMSLTPWPIWFRVYSSNKGYAGLNSNLVILADDDRIAATMENNYAQGQIIRGTSMSYPSFLKIVNSRRVEMQAGTLELALKENHLEALRDLATRMIP
jgi:hypothetical protein